MTESADSNAKRREAKRKKLTYYYLREYGMTVEHIKTLKDAQNGTCPICGKPFGRRRLAIDHCHASHVVRGLVHANCNRKIIPLFEMYADLADRVESYLAEPPAVAILGRIEVPETNRQRKKKK